MKKFLLGSLVCVLAVVGVYFVLAFDAHPGDDMMQWWWLDVEIETPLILDLPNIYRLNLSHLKAEANGNKLTTKMWDELVGHVEKNSWNVAQMNDYYLHEFDLVWKELAKCSITYRWELWPRGTCSTSCGTGTQSRTAHCVRSTDGTVVADSFCTEFMPAKVKPCDPVNPPCTGYHWDAWCWKNNCTSTPTLGTSWWACDRSCGWGIQHKNCTENTNGVRTRDVVCKNAAWAVVATGNCSGLIPPDTSEPCESKLCGTASYQTCQTCNTQACAPCTSSTQCPDILTCVGVTYGPSYCKVCPAGTICWSSLGGVTTAYNFNGSSPFLAFDWKLFLGITVYAEPNQCNYLQSECDSKPGCYWHTPVNPWTCQGAAKKCLKIVPGGADCESDVTTA